MEKMSIPEGLDVLREGDAVVIRRNWRTLMALPLFFFLIPWFGFLGFWYYHAFTDKHAPLMMLLFPLLHVAVGVGLAYFAVASLVNKTDITISTSSIRALTGPLPWLGNCEIRAGDIQGVKVRERRGGKGAVSYAVMYVDASNKECTFSRPMPQLEQAEFVAASIRQFFGLPA